MIDIDRTSSVPVHEQLAEKLRYLIASSHFKVDELLPSTRTLAGQIGISFHTVRKAYQLLEQEGLLEARIGSGFRIKERSPLGKSERIERGASIVQDALQKLIGLGLPETEIEYLIQEKLDLLSGSPNQMKLLFAASYQEMADLCAEQLTLALQHSVEPTTFDWLSRHQDADFLLARYADLQNIMQALPRVDALGVVTYLKPEALEQVARLLPHNTLGLITRFPDAIPPLMTELRIQTNFSGQTLATTIDEGTQHLERLIEQTDLLVYTPTCRRRLLNFLSDGVKHTTISPIVSRDSIEHIRQVIPI